VNGDDIMRVPGKSSAIILAEQTPGPRALSVAARLPLSALTSLSPSLPQKT